MEWKAFGTWVASALKAVLGRMKSRASSPRELVPPENADKRKQGVEGNNGKIMRGMHGRDP